MTLAQKIAAGLALAMILYLAQRYLYTIILLWCLKIFHVDIVDLLKLEDSEAVRYVIDKMRTEYDLVIYRMYAEAEQFIRNNAKDDEELIKALATYDRCRNEHLSVLSCGPRFAWMSLVPHSPLTFDGERLILYKRGGWKHNRDIRRISWARFFIRNVAIRRDKTQKARGN